MGLQDRWQKNLAILRGPAVAPAVMDVDVPPIEDRVAGGGTRRGRGVEVSKAHAACRHAVEHGSLANRMARATEHIPPHLVGHDEEHVRSYLRAGIAMVTPVAELPTHDETPC